MTGEPVQPAPAEPPAEPGGARPSRPRWLPWAILAAAVAVGLIVWLVTAGDDDPAPSAAVAPGVPTILAQDDLRAWGAAQPGPVYWAGPQPGTQYEVTQPANGRTFIRYLPEGQPAGSGKRTLTVGTYAGTNAYGALRQVGRRKGQVQRQTQSGALVVYARSSPRSVYFAFPDEQVQVEVFDPQAGVARDLVLSGQVQRLR